MIPGNNDNQTTITRKTKIKQKHKHHNQQLQDPSLLGNQQNLGPHMVQPQNRSSSSSSSSSDNQRKKGFVGTQPVGLSGQTGLTNQPGYGQQGLSSQQSYMQPGMQNQGMTGTQFTPNQGISGQGHTGQSQYPVNQYGQIPPAKTLAKNEAKIGFVEKMKQKVFHHGQKQ